MAPGGKEGLEAKKKKKSERIWQKYRFCLRGVSISSRKSYEQLEQLKQNDMFIRKCMVLLRFPWVVH